MSRIESNTENANQPGYPLHGRCSCSHLRYAMLAAPLIIHNCHCSSCQRETGTTSALNAVIETSNVRVLSPAPTSTTLGQHYSPYEELWPGLLVVPTPTVSGAGKEQQIVRCPKCYVAVWSHYAGAGTRMVFIRVGTLEREQRERALREAGKPDVCIYTGERMGWVELPKQVEEGGKCFTEFYQREEVWSAEALERLKTLRGAS